MDCFHILYCIFAISFGPIFLFFSWKVLNKQRASNSTKMKHFANHIQHRRYLHNFRSYVALLFYIAVVDDTRVLVVEGRMFCVYFISVSFFFFVVFVAFPHFYRSDWLTVCTKMSRYENEDAWSVAATWQKEWRRCTSTQHITIYLSGRHAHANDPLSFRSKFTKHMICKMFPHSTFDALKLIWWTTVCILHIVGACVHRVGRTRRKLLLCSGIFVDDGTSTTEIMTFLSILFLSILWLHGTESISK